MLEDLNSFDIVDRIDSKIDEAIQSVMALNAEYNYTTDDLDKLINDEETLREYIADTEETFNLPKIQLEQLSTEELNKYIKELDERWC